MKNKFSRMRGFTLVELLIVIALIAILSVAVLATINPIEQTNKARDAKFKNDSAEVLGALERFYASQNEYPWNQVTDGVGASVGPNISVALVSTDGRFGVGTSSSTQDGVLITTSELKGSFRGKEPFVAGAKPENKMYVYHSGITNSNYVCFIPKAAANRQGSKAGELKCLDLAGAKLVDQGSNGCVIPSPFTLDIGVSDATLSCVPEGAIN